MGDECRDLAENGDRCDEARPELPQEFRGGGFLDFVRGGSNGWLEMATTLLPKRKRMTKMDRIMEGTEGWGRLHARIHRIRPARPGGRRPDRVRRATAVGLRSLRVLGSWTGPQRGLGTRRPASDAPRSFSPALAAPDACRNRSPGRSGRPRPAGNCPAGPAPILYAACPSPRAWTGSGPPI